MNIKEKAALRIKEMMEVIKLLISWFPSLFHKRDIWLISERGKEARDNGYFFFVWLKNNHPDINSKFIISRDSPDLNRLARWSDDLVYFNSFAHLSSIWKAKYLISTHICGYTTDLQFFSKLDGAFNLFRGKKRVFLQHGIIKDRLPGLYYGKTHIDLFICGSRLEYDFVKSTFGYPAGVVQYTGLCRYDSLYEYQSKKQILVMPTFRIYVDRAHFEFSDYFKAYKELLCNKDLHNLLADKGYRLVFYPHYEFQSLIQSFKDLVIPEQIIVADMSFDIQTLLKESEILITDYSSVFFDMMYMNKPIVFYQFDEEQYRARHYQQGYLDYNDVGPVVRNVNQVVSSLFEIINSGRIADKFQKYYNDTFSIRDMKNCQRVYNAIIGDFNNL